MNKIHINLFFFFFIFFSCYSQNPIIRFQEDSIYRNKIDFSIEGLVFDSAHATQHSPHYWFFWEFGDGSYEQCDNKKTVSHIYLSKDSTYKVRLGVSYAHLAENPTKNVYDTVLHVKNSPNMREYTATLPKLAEDEFLTMETATNLELLLNEEAIYSLNYKATKDMKKGGYLLLCSNPNDEKWALTFDEKERTYFGEKEMINLGFIPPHFYEEIDSVWEDEKRKTRKEINAYHSWKIWKIENMKAGETRTLFFTLKVKGNEKIRAGTETTIFVKFFNLEEDYPVSEKITLPILASHDPNRITQLSKSRLSRTEVCKNGLLYKVDFQNEGNLSTNKIGIKVFFPKNLKIKKVEIEEFSVRKEVIKNLPIKSSLDGKDYKTLFVLKDSLMKKKDTLNFIFNKNIELLGMGQLKNRKKMKDSTCGYLIFRVYPERKKVPLWANVHAYSHIFFDENPPVSTKKIRTRIRDMRFGLKIGVNSTPLGKSNHFPFYIPYNSQRIFKTKEEFREISMAVIQHQMHIGLFYEQNIPKCTWLTLAGEWTLGNAFTVGNDRFKTNIREEWVSKNKFDSTIFNLFITPISEVPLYLYNNPDKKIKVFPYMSIIGIAKFRPFHLTPIGFNVGTGIAYAKPRYEGGNNEKTLYFIPWVLSTEIGFGRFRTQNGFLLARTSLEIRYNVRQFLNYSNYQNLGLYERMNRQALQVSLNIRI